MGGAREMYECLEYIRSGSVKPHIVEIDMTEIPQYMSNIKTLATVGKVVVKINKPVV